MVQKIGEMNGGWALLLKIQLALLPIIIMWIAWASVSIVQIQANRFTSQDWIEAMDRLEKKMPPQWVVLLLEDHTKRIERLEDRDR